MTSLVIVYHRQPLEELTTNGKVEYREHRSPNGIIPTLRGFFERVDDACWVAWTQSSGKLGDSTTSTTVRIHGERCDYQVVRVRLSAEEISQFYHITSKEALWPVINSFPSHYATYNTRWTTFREVNRRFAAAACEAASPGAVVWVHDYNLWLVPGFIRRLRPDLRIAFFHHTAFPAPDLFAMLPWRNEILDSLLACDQIGFHIPRYARNFCQLVEALRDDVEIEDAPVPRWMGATGQALSERRTPIAVKVGSRRIHIDSLPIAVPADYIGEVASRPEVQQRSAQIVGDLGGGTRILSVGRVDYVKGIRQQLETYTRLLDRRKDLHGRVRLLLVAAAAADGMTVYKAAQREIEQLVGHVNGKFGRIDWSPITLSTRPMPFEEVVAAYCATEIAWITPLRDGMNLVAKEYVAARVDGDGLLVLSEFAGAAVELPEAILTNPYSLIQMDEAIERAIDMSEAERRKRMASMRQHVLQYDAAFWASTVLERFASLADWDVSMKT